MAVVTIRDAMSGKSFQGVEGFKLYIYAENAGVLTLTAPFAPRVIEYGGWAMRWSEVERSGTRPLLLRSGDNLETMSFSLMLASRDPFESQADTLAKIKALARTRERVLVRYSVAEAGLWRLTDVSVTSEQRHPDHNEPTRAVVSFQFTAASDPAPAVGPVTRPPAPPPPPPPAQRTHFVVPGNTLWGISQQYYNNGTLWPRIYDANRNIIKDPHWIYPRQVFVIP